MGCYSLCFETAERQNDRLSQPYNEERRHDVIAPERHPTTSSNVPHRVEDAIQQPTLATRASQLPAAVPIPLTSSNNTATTTTAATRIQTTSVVRTVSATGDSAVRTTSVSGGDTASHARQRPSHGAPSSRENDNRVVEMTSSRGQRTQSQSQERTQRRRSPIDWDDEPVEPVRLAPRSERHRQQKITIRFV